MSASPSYPSLRFGMFMGPFHATNLDPTYALERDLQTIQLLDRLGYDEAWIGEHHSGGFEIIGSPEVFIAAAAERTKHIKLGTGVVSLPYHNPFILADRAARLRQLSQFRALVQPMECADRAHADHAQVALPVV